MGDRSLPGLRCTVDPYSQGKKAFFHVCSGLSLANVFYIAFSREKDKRCTFSFLYSSVGD